MQAVQKKKKNGHRFTRVQSEIVNRTVDYTFTCVKGDIVNCTVNVYIYMRTGRYRQPNNNLKYLHVYTDNAKKQKQKPHVFIF